VRRLDGTDVMLIATVVIWAFNITVTKYVLTHGFQPLAYASVRYGGAALLTVGVALVLERSLRIGGRREALLVALASLFLLLNQLAFVYSLKLATATTVALVLGATPVFTALVSSGVGLERLPLGFWIAALITFGGVALVALGAGGDLSGSLGGALLAVGLSATWALYSVTVAPLMERHSPYRTSALVLLAMIVPFVLISLGQLGAQDYRDLSWIVWLGLLYAIIGPLALTNILWFTAIRRVGPSRASLFANMQPFLAALIAAVVLSEHLSPLEVVGGLAILAGILLERTYPSVTAAPAE
jgi:drug/metabolite transporter (DMT)-like permease